MYLMWVRKSRGGGQEIEWVDEETSGKETSENLVSTSLNYVVGIYNPKTMNIGEATGPKSLAENTTL